MMLQRCWSFWSFKWPICSECIVCEQHVSSNHHTQSAILLGVWYWEIILEPLWIFETVLTSDGWNFLVQLHLFSKSADEPFRTVSSHLEYECCEKGIPCIKAWSSTIHCNCDPPSAVLGHTLMLYPGGDLKMLDVCNLWGTITIYWEGKCILVCFSKENLFMF